MGYDPEVPVYLKAVLAIAVMSAVMVALFVLGGQSMDSVRGYRRWRVIGLGFSMVSLVYIVLRLRHRHLPASFIGIVILILAAFVFGRVTRKPL